jgi:hypothetical protein
MAARPDDSILTPTMMQTFHMTTLGMVSLQMVPSSPCGIFREMPCERTASQRMGMEPSMHSERKAMGGKNCTPIFMMGQFMPQHTVRRTSNSQSLRESDVMPAR